MTIKKIFKDSPLPRAETRDLLCHVIKKDPAFLLAHPEYKLTKSQANKLTKLVKLRKLGTPLAYLLKSQPFGGLNFFVDKRVLIPRPETELLIDEAIKLVTRHSLLVTAVDVGTGSGAIAISLAHHFQKTPQHVNIIATDVSSAALTVARKNAKLHKLDRQIKFLKSNLLAPVFKYLPNSGHLIVIANLPYLSEKLYRANPELAFEPKKALLAGKDGLDCYRELLRQLKQWRHSKDVIPSKTEGSPKNINALTGMRRRSFTTLLVGFRMTVLLEISPEQSTTIKKLIHHHFPQAKPEIKKDAAKRDRVVWAELRSKN